VWSNEFPFFNVFFIFYFFVSSSLVIIEWLVKMFKSEPIHPHWSEDRFYLLGFSAESAKPSLNAQFRAFNWIKLRLNDQVTLNEIGKTGPKSSSTRLISSRILGALESLNIELQAQQIKRIYIVWPKIRKWTNKVKRKSEESKQMLERRRFWIHPCKQLSALLHAVIIAGRW